MKNYILLKRCLIFFSIFIIITSLFTFSAYAAAADDDTKPGFFEKSLAGLLRGIAWSGQQIIEKTGANIDTLVFNKDGSTDTFKNQSKTSGLTLLRNTDTSKYIYSVYTGIQYMGITIFLSIGSLLTIDILRSQNDSQHKKILKGRFIRFVATIALLVSMPALLDMLIQINNVLVDIFSSFVSNPNANSSGFMMKDFYTLASKEKRLIPSCLYLMSVVLNFWMIFYYFIRDLTMIFLFLIFPFIIVLFIYQKERVIEWFKQLCSNLFSQAIQAFILAILVGIATNIYKSGNPSLYDQMFILVAFCAFIPVTGLTKRLLGLETNVGAGASMAGVGGVLALGQIVRPVKKNISNFTEGAAEYKNTKATERLNKKNVNDINPRFNNKINDTNTSSNDSDNFSNLSTRVGQGKENLEKLKLQGEKVNAKKKMAKSVASMAGGTFLVGIGAMGGAAFGARGAVEGAKLTNKILESSKNKEKKEDMNDEIIMQEHYARLEEIRQQREELLQKQKDNLKNMNYI